MALDSAITIARVMHKRLRPREHGFSYRVYYLCFKLSQMQSISNRFLSIEKWNLMSFYRRDHGARDGSDPESWIREVLASFRLTEVGGEIILLTMPRILGYVFNPVSFWFCLDSKGQLRAVLSEVSNTFGEHHCYISCHDDHRVIAPDEWLRADKVFHVSPFMDVTGYYMFRFSCADNKIAASVNHFDDEGLLLATSVTGDLAPLTSAAAIRAFLFYPLVTFKVIVLIHFEAIRLVLKGLRYFRKPLPPLHEVTR